MNTNLRGGFHEEDRGENEQHEAVLNVVGKLVEPMGHARPGWRLQEISAESERVVRDGDILRGIARV